MLKWKKLGETNKRIRSGFRPQILETKGRRVAIRTMITVNGIQNSFEITLQTNGH